MIIGTNIDLRDITVNDAAFVLSLRLDPLLNMHLSPVGKDVRKQEKWLEKAIQNPKEWYFIIQNKMADPVGTIRIYDIQENSFCWGSWIVLPHARRYASFESAILLYDFAFSTLGFHRSHFDVRKENGTVINFHLKCGARRVGETEKDILFDFTKTDFYANKPSYDAKIAEIHEKMQQYTLGGNDENI